ncbi:MAG: helix-hairpin-helix domain-containing protein, partial [Bacteroidota bacterium]
MSKFPSFQRWLFFLYDKLQITRNERITISVLFTLAVILTLVNVFLEQRIHRYDEQHAEVLEAFNARSEKMRNQQEEIARRYQPPTASAVEPDSNVSIQQNMESQSEPLTVERININTATKEELMQIDGIGPAYAQRILDYRNTIGAFTN